MQYFGGKQRIAKKLATILGPIANEKSAYVEPFIGGASVMCEIQVPLRIASDANEALITMWQSLSKGWQPPVVISESDYATIKLRNDKNDPITAFAGFGCSFAGKWFGGYARSSEKRNYAQNAANSLKKKMQHLSNVEWSTSDYRELKYPQNSVIYCDPPYQSTTGYNAVGAFDWCEFWNFVRKKTSDGHIVFVSEYNAPSDFKVCLEIPTKLDIRDHTGLRPLRTEKLFTLDK